MEPFHLNLEKLDRPLTEISHNMIIMTSKIKKVRNKEVSEPHTMKAIAGYWITLSFSTCLK